MLGRFPRPPNDLGLNIALLNIPLHWGTRTAHHLSIFILKACIVFSFWFSKKTRGGGGDIKMKLGLLIFLFVVSGQAHFCGTGFDFKSVCVCVYTFIPGI